MAAKADVRRSCLDAQLNPAVNRRNPPSTYGALPSRVLQVIQQKAATTGKRRTTQKLTTFRTLQEHKDVNNPTSQRRRPHVAGAKLSRQTPDPKF
jgi:hypothetical protein